MTGQAEAAAAGTPLAAMRAAARDAAAYIASRARDLPRLRWESKLPTDFVSEVDLGAERLIAERLGAAHPDATVVGEELSPAAEWRRGLAFVVDPLDGTTNFLHGYPEYAVSIAAVRDGALLAGVVHNVATGEQFSAVAGGGAWRDGRPIAVSAIDDAARALVGTGIPFKYPEQIAGYLPQLAAVTRATAGVRRAGSAALDLCDVACGRFEAFWELTLAPWDFAAGMLIIREAGGVVTDPAGAPPPLASSGIVAGNPAMHAWLLATLRAAAEGGT